MIKSKGIFKRDKFREAILYLIANSPNGAIEGKKKLAKLLYLVDFNFFEEFEKPFTGATYRALPMGPVPQELDVTLSELEGTEVNVEKKEIGLPNALHVYVLRSKGPEFHLSKEEKQVLDKVIQDFGTLSGKVLEDITHSEAPYNAVAPGEQIPYELAFYRGKPSGDLIGG